MNVFSVPIPDVRKRGRPRKNTVKREVVGSRRSDRKRPWTEIQPVVEVVKKSHRKDEESSSVCIFALFISKYFACFIGHME